MDGLVSGNDFFHQDTQERATAVQLDEPQAASDGGHPKNIFNQITGQIPDKLPTDMINNLGGNSHKLV